MSQKRRIKIFASNESGPIFEKEFSELPISFGRNPTNQVTLPFEFVSRTHCMLVEQDDGLVLVDMHSSHGLLVDGQKVERAKITDELAFMIKSVVVKIEVTGATDHVSVTAAANEVTAPSIPPMPRPSTMMPPPPPRKAPASEPPIYGPAPTAKPKAPSAPPIVPAAPKPQSVGNRAFDRAVGVHSHRVPMVEKDFRPELIGSHPMAVKAQFRKIEAVVSWHDVIYDMQEFDPADKITLGPLGKADIAVPIFRRSFTVAKVGQDSTSCFALKDHNVTLVKENKSYSKTELMGAGALGQRGSTIHWTIDPLTTSTVDFGSGVKLHLRYVPGTKALSRTKMIEPDEAFKQSIIGSGILHCGLALIIWMMAPAAEKGPKLKNVPERYARLLVQKPKPKPKPTPPPAPKEVVKKEPPKPIEKPVVKHQPIKTPKVIAKKNKFPMVVEHPIPKAPPPVKVEALGALGALGAISKTPTNVVTNININPNAGGLPQKALNTGGIAGALPSSNGKLAAAGGPSVKTKGFGYGTGTGYGIQGMKGTAGTRGVAGAIVGEPKLAQMARLEGLSRAQVMAVLKQYMGEVQHCYERNLLANPDLAGRIDFEWDISPAGKVTDVRVKRSTVNNGDGLTDCVRKIFLGMAFPKATNGMITTPSIGFPFGRL